MASFPGEFPKYIGSPEYVPADADPWERVVRLGWQRRWLELKCDELLRSCRDLSGSLNGRSPLAPADVAALRAASPRRPLGEVQDALYRLREEAAAGTPPRPTGVTDDALAAQGTGLAADMLPLRARRDELRRMFFALFEAVAPDAPLTDEDVRRMRAEPPGPSIGEVLAELEKELGL